MQVTIDKKLLSEVKQYVWLFDGFADVTEFETSLTRGFGFNDIQLSKASHQRRFTI